MQRILSALLTLLIVAFGVCACSNPVTQGDGTLTDQTLPLKNIQSVKINGHFLIHILPGAQASLKIHTDQNLQTLLSVKQQDGLLTIDSKGMIKPSAIPELTITGSNLSQVEINGDNNVDLKQIKAPHFTLLLSGHQRVHLTGATHTFDLKASGDNSLEAKDFKAKDVTLNASGHNNLVIACHQGNLTIKASGANKILYVGTPAHVQQQINGSTTVTTV